MINKTKNLTLIKTDGITYTYKVELNVNDLDIAIDYIKKDEDALNITPKQSYKDIEGIFNIDDSGKILSITILDSTNKVIAFRNLPHCEFLYLDISFESKAKSELGSLNIYALNR